MMIIGCDYHPGFQQIARLNTDTGERQEQRLGHREEAEQFYHDLKTCSMTVRVGMEASGHARWFERLLADLKFELWLGDAAAIRTKRCCQTHSCFRSCCWKIASENLGADAENRDLRQLLWHRHRWCRCARAS
jgi:hypothetical protein